MREDVRRLLVQARRDLEIAEKNIGLKAFEVTAFLCEQSVEKGMKALYVHRLKRRAPAIHSLIEIARPLAIPKALREPLALLNMDYVASRYPDAANGIPAEIYTKSMAEGRVAAARKVWVWIEKQV